MLTALEERQQSLERTAAVVGQLAHDFSNALTGILGFAELSQAHLPSGSLPHQYVGEVLDSAQNAASWVRKLQVFSQRTPHQVGTTWLAPFLQQEANRLRTAWGNQITVLANVPKDLPCLPIAAGTLRQLLDPLFDNAREAIDGPGVVAISARVVDLGARECAGLIGLPSAGRHAEIAITDTGCGLSAAARARLPGDLFFSTKPGHRGLGLAVVYGLLRACGGGLRLGQAVGRAFQPDSEPDRQAGKPDLHEAQGTAVHVFLPLNPPSTT
jgi:signal transduction histidine kinase